MADIKDCCHDDDHFRHRLPRTILIAILSLSFLILVVVLLIIYLILHPTKPQFTLQDATLYAFNLSQPPNNNLLTTTFQVTLSSHNPNALIGVFYDRLDVHASYRHQQITLPSSLPPAYQGHHDISVWSPFLFGASIPVAPYLMASLCQDQSSGLVLVNVMIDGRVRWKVGAWISGRYHLWVNCPAYITFGSRNKGGFVGSAVKYQFATSCHVDV